MRSVGGFRSLLSPPPLHPLAAPPPTAQAAVEVDLRPVPDTDADLAPWHYEALVRFAHDVDPEMMHTIPEAW